MIWVVSIQGYRYVKFTKPYASALVLCFKEEKRSPSHRENVLQSLEPDLTVLDLRLDTVLLCDLRQVMLPLCALLPHCG